MTVLPVESGSFEECNIMAVFGRREVWPKGQMVLVWDAGTLVQHVVAVNLWCLRETTFEHINVGLKNSICHFYQSILYYLPPTELSDNLTSI